jgi:hypothetical protein
VALKHILGDDFPGQFTSEDISYITGLTVFSELLAEQWAEFSTRGKHIISSFCVCFYQYLDQFILLFLP